MDQPETIKIDDVEYVRRDSIPMIQSANYNVGPWEIGKNYLLRLATVCDGC